MSRPKGLPKTGGKKKGTQNIKTRVMKTVDELCRQHGIDPLEVMFRHMKLPMPKHLKLKPVEKFQAQMQVHQFRNRAAEAAAPYTRPKLSQSEVRGTGPGGAHMNVNHNIERLDPNDPNTYEAARRIAFAMAEGVRLAKMKTIEPPKG